MKEPATLSSDHELLLDRCRQKDSAAIQKLVSIYGESFYGFIRCLLGGNANLIDPILTASFIDTLRSSAESNTDEPFRVILLRAALKNAEKNLGQPREPLLGIDKRLSVLWECLGDLSREEQVVLLLRDQMDCSLDEMQAILSETEHPIRGRLQFARLHFRDLLQNKLNAKDPHSL